MERVISIKDGLVKHVYADDFIVGTGSIKRASHVEPSPDGTWFVDLSPVGGPLRKGFVKRQEALDWEVAWINDQLRKGAI
jgi:hypothetical protein